MKSVLAPVVIVLASITAAHAQSMPYGAPANPYGAARAIPPTRWNAPTIDPYQQNDTYLVRPQPGGVVTVQPLFPQPYSSNRCATRLGGCQDDE